MQQHHHRFVRSFVRSQKAKGATVALLALAASLAAAGVAEAGTIFLNSPNYPGGYSSFNSQKTDQVDNKAYDDFTLLSADTILSITWQGQYRPTNNGGLEPAPTATDFLVQFYSDAAGLPGSLLSTGLYSVAQTNQTRIGSASFGPVAGVTSTVGIYNYSLNITPFAVAAGTTYWLMIQAQTGTLENPAWGWLSGGSPGSTYQQIGESGTLRTEGNRAFSLSNTPVPEPTTLVLLGAGLVGVAAKMRRRRTVR